MTAWALSQRGHRVELFEKDRLMGATSSASTKLLHGGLRYLETGHFRLVREALQERAWWIAQAPHLAQSIRLFLPAYEKVGRPAWLVRLGLACYDLLAYGSGFPRHRWHDSEDLGDSIPGLKTAGLQGGFSFLDAQMDDLALGLWAADQVRQMGVAIHEEAEVRTVDTSGYLEVGEQKLHFDCIINVAGPWAQQLLQRSNIPSRYRLDLVRGSHILFDGPCPAGCLLQVPGEKRVFFVLPYDGKILVGTTEVRQDLTASIECSNAEIDYLLRAYNYYFDNAKFRADVVACFAGLRPLIHSASDPGRATREYAIERNGNLISVFGGKWTTARKLGLAVANHIGV